MALLRIRVIPNAKQSCLVDWFEGQDGESLRIRLSAPPVDGKANKALVIFLAKSLAISKSQVSITKGEKNRQKIVEISGINEQDLREKVDSLLRE